MTDGSLDMYETAWNQRGKDGLEVKREGMEILHSEQVRYATKVRPRERARESTREWIRGTRPVSWRGGKEQPVQRLLALKGEKG